MSVNKRDVQYMGLWLFPLLFLGSSADAAGVSVNLPCVANTASCPLSFLQCSKVSAEIKKDVEALVTKKINYFYSNGLDVDVISPIQNSSNANSTIAPGSISLSRPICNMALDEISTVNNPHSAITPGQYQSCGQPIRYTVDGIDVSNQRGQAENAYMNGMFLQALLSYQQKIFNQIDSGNKIQIESNVAAATSAQKLMDDFSKNESSTTLASVCNVPASCLVNLDQSCDAGGALLSVDSVGGACQQRGAICDLRSAQSHAVSAMKYLIFSEIETQARNAMLNQRATVNNALFNEARKPCMDQAKANCTMDAGAGLGPYVNRDCWVNSMNACYPNKMRATMRSLTSQLFPLNGNPVYAGSGVADSGPSNCNAACESLQEATTAQNDVRQKLIIAAGVVAGLLAAIAVAYAMAWLTFGLSLIAAGVLTATLTALLIAIAVLPPMITLPATCMASYTPSGECNMPPVPDNTKVNVSGSGPGGGASGIVQFAGAMTNANKDLAKAKLLASDGTASAAEQSAATEGNTAETLTTQNGLGNIGAGFKNSGNGSGISGSGGSGDSTGSALDTSGSTTVASAEPQDQGTAFFGDPGAGYASAGSNSAATAGGGSQSSRRPGSVNLGAGKLSEMAFGDQNAAGADDGMKAMLGEDPNDYFTRLNLDESIFKIVHTRYESKSRAWSMDYLKTIPKK